jgi:xanthine dehydrogenase YagT iron-sulfur-binding subunit
MALFSVGPNPGGLRQNVQVENSRRARHPDKTSCDDSHPAQWTSSCISFYAAKSGDKKPMPEQPIRLLINGAVHTLRIEPRVSLLDALREYLGLTGAKKGCNQGACGACTVLVDGERTLSCLALAVQYEGREITTIEGLAENGTLHPMQAAFVEHDGFQCGYCTPGQICSAVGMVQEFHKGLASAVTNNVFGPAAELSDEEIKERMSGNLCRCGAYVGIREAIREAAEVAR